MSADWVWPVVAVAGGLVVGTAGAWTTRAVLRRESMRREVREVAPAVAAFVFWISLAAGVFAAVAAAEPQTIEEVPANLLAYLPRVLAAGLIVLAGRALAVAVAAATGRAVAQALGRPSTAASSIARAGVNLAAIVLALAQLGIDTTVLVVLAVGVTVGMSLAFGLLVGLGGREIASEMAAGRYLRRHLALGSDITVDGLTGRIVAFHPAGLELKTETGRRVHLPHRRLLHGVVEILGPARDSPRPPGPGPN